MSKITSLRIHKALKESTVDIGEINISFQEQLYIQTRNIDFHVNNKRLQNKRLCIKLAIEDAIEIRDFLNYVLPK